MESGDDEWLDETNQFIENFDSAIHDVKGLLKLLSTELHPIHTRESL
jgi:hypothetical protein